MVICDPSRDFIASLYYQINNNQVLLLFSNGTDVSTYAVSRRNAFVTGKKFRLKDELSRSCRNVKK